MTGPMQLKCRVMRKCQTEPGSHGPKRNARPTISLSLPRTHSLDEELNSFKHTPTVQEFQVH